MLSTCICDTIPILLSAYSATASSRGTWRGGYFYFRELIEFTQNLTIINGWGMVPHLPKIHFTRQDSSLCSLQLCNVPVAAIPASYAPFVLPVVTPNMPKVRCSLSSVIPKLFALPAW